METETGVGDNCDWTVDDCLERKFHCVISRLSVIQEADTGPTINILEATPGSAKPVSPTSNNLSNYFGTPQTSGAGGGDSIFDQLTSPRSGPDQAVEAGGFTDISINTPVKRAAVTRRSNVPTSSEILYTPTASSTPAATLFADKPPNTPARGSKVGSFFPQKLLDVNYCLFSGKCSS